MGTDLFIKAHAVYSYAKVSALTRKGGETMRVKVRSV